MNPIIDFVQQYAPLFAVLAAIATVLGLAFTIYKTAHDRQVRTLQEQVRTLQEQVRLKNQEIAELKKDGHDELRLVVQQLKDQLEQAKLEAKNLRAKHSVEVSDLNGEIAHLRDTGATLTQKLESAHEERERRDRADRARGRLLKVAMKLEGRLWQRKVLQGAPRFRPLGERHTAILSVLNLKGGVGKTTLTAHLAAAFMSKGYRVLTADLDLQGSLSGLFVGESALVKLSREKLILQDFLAAATGRKANLLDYCTPVLGNGSALIPSADSMAYAELNLTMQWLLRQGRRDTRFLLRKALHQKRITNRFDIVLLDCPPLFNTCCVNALAASDYILIPVLPSRKAAERVPLLLERLQGLQPVINPQLRVIGAVLNRTHGLQLTAWERDLWKEMLELGQDRWKLPVPAFETHIRQTTEVRDGETEFAPPAPGSELYDLFSRLAAEVEARLPGDCRRTAIAPVRPG